MAKGSVGELVIWLVAAGGVATLIYVDPAQGCAKHSAPPTDASRVVTPDAAIVEAVVDATVPAEVAVVDALAEAPPAEPLYTVTEAFEDIASGPLEFIGTGEWYGNFSIHGCAYRNKRVIVAYQYCTMKEQPALGLTVISPTKGRINIYAESEGPISTRTRADYFSFRIEGERPFEGIELSTTYADLRAWDERRYNAHVGVCWYENGVDCSNGAAPGDWGESAKAFIDEPPAEFYRLAKDLHARAVRDLRRK